MGALELWGISYAGGASGPWGALTGLIQLAQPPLRCPPELCPCPAPGGPFSLPCSPGQVLGEVLLSHLGVPLGSQPAFPLRSSSTFVAPWQVGGICRCWLTFGKCLVCGLSVRLVILIPNVHKLLLIMSLIKKPL